MLESQLVFPPLLSAPFRAVSFFFAVPYLNWSCSIYSATFYVQNKAFSASISRRDLSEPVELPSVSRQRGPKCERSTPLVEGFLVLSALSRRGSTSSQELK
jgi:hypothetical protein